MGGENGECVDYTSLDVHLTSLRERTRQTKRRERERKVQGVRGCRVGLWWSLPEGLTKAVTGAPLTEETSVTPKKPQEKAQKTKSNSRKERTETRILSRMCRASVQVNT